VLLVDGAENCPRKKGDTSCLTHRWLTLLSCILG
jgi:hypothetical protein